MENVGFQPSGEEIERALMDLGPLLGVSIKEEVPDEAAESGAPPPPPAPPTTVNALEGGVAGVAGAGGAGGEGGDAKEGAESLAARASPAAARCVFCGVPLTQADGTPKLMECLHSTCEACLKAKVDEKQANSRDFLGAERITIMCPSCRLQCQPSNMIDQQFVIEKMSLDQAGTSGGASGAHQCNSCDDTEPATSYCVDCAEFICDNCVHAHQRLKITKDHTIKGKEEAVAELQAAQRSAHDLFCREHPQERLSLFCETCDRLTCRDCQLHHHRDHKYQFSTEMAAQARSSLSGLLSEVSYKRVLLSSAMKVIADRQQLIADKKKALVHEITQTVVKLTNAINSRGKQLVLRLSEVCDGKQRTLAEKKAALEQLAGITDHCVGFVGGALAGASDAALLSARPLLHHHLARIKQRRADIPNPEIPVRITLQLDKLPELLRVLNAVGSIVVDGKPDGAAPAPPAPAPLALAPPAQGPYHPPPSAVVALQHHALHQTLASYQQYVGGGAGSMGPGAGGMGPGAGGMGPGAGAWAAGGRRGATPLRHAHVSSTTHPHQLHGMNEMNLRGLLGARGVRPAAHHAMQAYHHMMGAYASGAFGAGAAATVNGASMTQAGMGGSPMGGNAMGSNAMGGGSMGGSLPGGSAGAARRSVGPRTPSPAPPPPAYHHPAAKWHIPQHAAAGAAEAGAGPAGADFKIQLGRPAGPRPAPAVVTSTNPKTPSPNLNGGASLELDKVCAESVQDLMATIAKLDSNGVQVVAEHERPAPSPAPAVHSSTDERGGAPAAPDPNEDWCAVCMDGGELMCCDKCPKVFHQYCHIPTIEKLPDESESWQCLLCVNFSGGGAEWSRVAERVTLELYCQYELSAGLRAPPHGLDAVRARLQPAHPRRYTAARHFVADCRAVFRAAYTYNAPESQTYKDAKRLEEFFDAQLVKLMPEFAYWNGEGEPPAKRPRAD